jgi:hypothetical protein
MNEYKRLSLAKKREKHALEVYLFSEIKQLEKVFVDAGREDGNPHMCWYRDVRIHFNLLYYPSIDFHTRVCVWRCIHTNCRGKHSVLDTR